MFNSNLASVTETLLSDIEKLNVISGLLSSSKVSPSFNLPDIKLLHFPEFDQPADRYVTQFGEFLSKEIHFDQAVKLYNLIIGQKYSDLTPTGGCLLLRLINCFAYAWLKRHEPEKAFALYCHDNLSALIDLSDLNSKKIFFQEASLICLNLIHKDEKIQYQYTERSMEYGLEAFRLALQISNDEQVQIELLYQITLIQEIYHFRQLKCLLEIIAEENLSLKELCFKSNQILFCLKRYANLARTFELQSIEHEIYHTLTVLFP